MIILSQVDKLSPSSYSTATASESSESSSCDFSMTSRNTLNQSTPFKTKLGNKVASNVNEERVLLAIELTPYCHSNVDLVDFAVHVWGLDRQVSVRILEHKWALDTAAKAKYELVLTGTGAREPQLYEPFRTIVTKLLDDMVKSGIVGTEAQASEIWHGEGKVYLRGTRRNRKDKKPDALQFSGTAPEIPDWPNVLNVYEFKLTPPEDNEKGGEETHNGSKHANSLPVIAQGSSRSRSTHRAGQSKSQKQKSKGKRPNNRSKAAKKSLATLPPIPPPDFAGASRGKNSLKRGSLHLDSETADRNTKKPKLASPHIASDAAHGHAKKPKLADSHLQAGSYALECLAATSRYYVVCIVIEGFYITVLYFDRTLVLKVASFNFETNPGALALVLYGTNACDRRHAGFDPHLRASPSTSSEVALDERPVDTPVGSYFEFEKVTETPEGEKSSIKKIYRVAEVLFKPTDIIGRATTVYKVQEHYSKDKLSSDHYALKLSWPLKSRTSEIEVIQRLKERLPEELHDHLPSLEFFTEFDAESLELPWLDLNIERNPSNHQERMLRILVEKKYSKLWEAGSIEAFKQAWLDCLECHHQAWEVAETLHRDLSQNNLMLYWDEDGNVKGVLNDWDMAAYKDTNRDNTTAAHHRTGTPPFMAIDLICTDRLATPRHAFRHELESMLYILVWAALHYDLAKKKKCKTQEVVKEWEGELSMIYSAKAKFMNEWATALKVFSSVRPEFSELCDKWIKPLWILFHTRTQSNVAQAHANVLGQEWDEDKFLDEKINFRTFMAAIGEKPRWAKDGKADK